MTFEEKKTILCKNLYEFNKRQTLTKDQKLLTIAELARLYSSESFVHTNDILESLLKLDDNLSACDEILFLSELCHSELRKKIKESLFIGSTEPTLAGAHSKITYVKNKYNDLAFEHFSHSVSNAKPYYASSFSEGQWREDI